MLIHFGTKLVRKWRGRRADFCTLCRDFRPHRVLEVRTVFHVNFIPLPLGRRQGYERACESCGLARLTPGAVNPHAVTRDRRADLETLLSETNPDAASLSANRLAYESRVRSGALTAQERRAAILEPFLSADTLLQGRSKEMHIDFISGLALLATVAAFAVAIALAAIFFRPGYEFLSQGAFATACAIGLGAVALLLTDVPRYARRAVLPHIVQALRPLKPSREEIEETIQTLKARRVRLGKNLKTVSIVEALTFPCD
jgi:hypothetical protein